MRLSDLLSQEGALYAPQVSEAEAPNGPRHCLRWSRGMVEFIGNGTNCVTDMGDIIAVVLHPDTNTNNDS